MKITIVLMAISLLLVQVVNAQPKDDSTFFCTFTHSYQNKDGELSDNATPLIIGRKAVIKILQDRIYLYSNGLYPSPIIFNLVYESPPPVSDSVASVVSHKGLLLTDKNIRHFETITINLTKPITFTYHDSSINVVFTGDCIIDRYKFN